MAGALARGWAAAEHGPEAMLFCDAGSGRAAALAEETGGEAVETLAELALRADAVVLAVKPAALDRAAAAARRRGRCGRFGAGRDAARAPARGLPGRAGGPRDADDHGRGPPRRDLPRAARARGRRGGRAAAQPVRRAQPSGRGARRADGRRRPR